MKPQVCNQLLYVNVVQNLHKFLILGGGWYCDLIDVKIILILVSYREYGMNIKFGKLLISVNIIFFLILGRAININKSPYKLF